MTESQTGAPMVLQEVSNAMVRLHKEQFGRGPTSVRSHFVGSDVLVCVLRDVLLPAELKMVQLGQSDRVRDSRVAFQAATEGEFLAAIEQIIRRKVVAFASGIDPIANVAFENFYFESPGSDGDMPPRTQDPM